MSADVRDELGRFTPGNPGGPGRPRRTIEREYMATLGEAVTLDDWREVVARAVADAKAGDQGARNWLAKYLMGSTPRTLLEIAADERIGLTPDDDIRYGHASKTRNDEGSELDDDWDEIWLGYTHPVAFIVPDHYEMRAVRSWRDENGTNWRSLGNACWFTNLDIAKRHEDLTLYRKFNRKLYPQYDNYDAIEVSTYKDIPDDFEGVMGVPVTFLEHHNPDQFEIVGTLESNDPDNDYRTRVYTSKECRDAYGKRFGKPGVYDLNASGVVDGIKVFKRILIRKKGE